MGILPPGFFHWKLSYYTESPARYSAGNWELCKCETCTEERKRRDAAHAFETADLNTEKEAYSDLPPRFYRWIYGTDSFFTRTHSHHKLQYLTSMLLNTKCSSPIVH